jgi:hypothetical protein
MPIGENTLRSRPPQAPQTRSGSSDIDWTTSMCSPQSVQAYSYVGIEAPLRRNELAVASERHGLSPDGTERLPSTVHSLAWLSECRGRHADDHRIRSSGI